MTSINLTGCAAFLISALFAFVRAQAPDFDAATISVIFTLIGAIGFFYRLAADAARDGIIGSGSVSICFVED